jgi:hypothetical protein
MSNLLKQVTPLTRGIIWFPKVDFLNTNPNYGDIDYLLDGLLTANLNQSLNFTSKLIIGRNFKSPFYVMVIQEVRESEIQSFVSLIKKDLHPGTDVVIVDEMNKFHLIKNEVREINSYLKLMNTFTLHKEII